MGMAVVASPGLKLKNCIAQKKVNNVVLTGLENFLSHLRALTHVV
jgi:hypothetical protein